MREAEARIQRQMHYTDDINYQIIKLKVIFKYDNVADINM